MTLLQFPDRIAEVRAERTQRRRRLRPSVALMNLATTLWLVPVLFWLSWIDAIEDEVDDGAGPLPGNRGDG